MRKAGEGAEEEWQGSAANEEMSFSTYKLVCGELESPRKIGAAVVDVLNSETSAKAAGPLEVVDRTPSERSSKIDTVLVDSE